MKDTKDLLYMLRVYPQIKLPPKSFLDIGREIEERDAKIEELESVIKQTCSFCCGWLEMKCSTARGEKCPVYKLKVEKEAQNDQG